ncbi:hypothetical protein N7489_003647 [Penicillium chrysogenum]|uniref:Uncharacterized protein n=1 Tax=Penicillium chrysogenum TaxID=5076 RepID=A0ABQ8WAD5_PENCH|nr:uncharacterized protein N7489_003647 [Penicillium chrysogenum]KAJ5253237.1 hypothetical protein N7489_003647 [Penicillium chrysogenum]KAJ5260460.1 hypothetical protein N7505_009841 [Penicillium chrysogenum]
MKVANIALAGTTLGLANATAVVKRGISDAPRPSFYADGLRNYTQEDFVKAGMNVPFYANIQEAASDDKSHVKFLTSALKAATASPVTATSWPSRTT